jgi:hypothetical protein
VVVINEGGSGWFAFWKWFDVSVNDEENFYRNVLYRWGEGVVLDGFIEWYSGLVVSRIVMYLGHKRLYLSCG